MSEQFRKKPVVIEAMEFTEESKNRVFHWITCNKYADWDEKGNSRIVIQTLEGNHDATLGDWVIKGVKGEFYPCKPDIFAITYDRVADDPPAPQAAASKLKPLPPAIRSKTSYSDKTLLDFIEKQLIRGMGWVPIWIDRDHVQIVVARVGYANTYPTFRDAVSQAYDETSATCKAYLPPLPTERPKSNLERSKPQERVKYEI